MSGGEVALAREEYGRAVELLRQELGAAGADAERTHLLLIRALLDEDKIVEAEAEMAAWPGGPQPDAWTLTALGEVAYRKGEISQAAEALQKAIAFDRCNPQTRSALARIYALNAMYRTARQMLDSAHQLDPGDDAIAKQWVAAQPLETQPEALEAYLRQSSAYRTEENTAELMERKQRLALAQTDRCSSKGAAASVALPYYFIQNGANANIFWGLQVKINGKTLNLVEDSTISGIYLKDSVVKDAHLTPVAGTTVSGISSLGNVTATVAHAATIAIGPLEFSNCDVMVATNDMKYYGQRVREEVRGAYLDRGSDGLIGPDAFRDYLVTLDKPGRQIRLDPLPAAAGAPSEANPQLITGVAPEFDPPTDRAIGGGTESWAKELRDGPYFLLPVRIDQSRVTTYSLATASGQNTISLELARSMNIAGNKAEELPSMAGNARQFFRTSEVTVDFLGVRRTLNWMSAVDMTPWSHNHGLELTGMLGAPVLNDYTLHLDYRDNLIKLEFDPKRTVHCPPNIRMPGCL